MTQDEAIDEAARHAGGRWAFSRRDELASDRRGVAGGWPGTVSEARAIVSHVLGRDKKLPHEQLDRAARIAYRTARDAWLLMLRAP